MDIRQLLSDDQPHPRTVGGQASNASNGSAQAVGGEASNAQNGAANSSPLLALPNEILLEILSSVSHYDLARLSQVNTKLQDFCSTPSLWAPFLHSFRLPPSYPYRALVASLHEHLWLRPRLWWSDQNCSGHLVTTFFELETETITLHTILAPRFPPNVKKWSRDPSVPVSSPATRVSRWPASLLSVNSHSKPDPRTGEIVEFIPDSPIAVSLFRVLAIPAGPPSSSSKFLWPPSSVPATVDRCANSESFDAGTYRAPYPSFASADLFRFRRELRHGTTQMRGEIETLSAIPASWYTPTRARPLRGIFIADIPDYGYQMLLFLQPTTATIDAVKLTGDTDLPRGKVLFTVRDLENIVRVADDSEWPGARVVPAGVRIGGRRHGLSAANVANIARNGNWEYAELFLVSNDKVALHWMGGREGDRIATFERIDVDTFVYGGGVQVFGGESW
ncbi:hypothetical protein BZA05DRAFT_381144 [Tricharina praecox]|uniref:uncharacterized protein n=1 Tax=Tricharina praecox TaxID=43433 RepID=UPI0022206CC8|nr:uncharacterized protein BZA05DRAFT_381144 [Tricharina praecox]KAI5858417.1 hypothetical protein BZA05DRAFT_381144 [Tricharina praecox]